MQCPTCGYHLAPLESSCPRCSGQTRTVPARATPRDADNRWRTLLPFAALMCTAVVTWAALYSFIWLPAERSRAAAAVARARAEAEREAAAREARIERARQALAGAYPDARFVRFAGYGGPTVFNATFKQCGVSNVTVRYDEGQLGATVGLVGLRSHPAAPSVYVSLYGEAGQLLAGGHVVCFTRASLMPGERRDVEDLLSPTPSGEPVLVGIAEEPPTVERMAETYRARAEADFNRMFPYGQAAPLLTEVRLYRQPPGYAWVATGKVDVRFDSGRRVTYDWRLRYAVTGGNPNAESKLVLRDLVGDGPDWGWPAHSDDRGVTWY